MEILLLEDDPALRYALSEVLEGEGYMFCAVADINAAAEILRKRSPDLLLLDLMIGNECSAQIADLAGYCVPEAEVIYLTGSNKFPNGELFQLYKNTSWVLRKPVDFVDLKAMIAHFGRSVMRKPVGRAVEPAPMHERA